MIKRLNFETSAIFLAKKLDQSVHQISSICRSKTNNTIVKNCNVTLSKIAFFAKTADSLNDNIENQSNVHKY